MEPAKMPQVYYGFSEQASVLELKGPIRYMTAQALRRFVDDVVVQDGSATVLIDLREVEAIDSTGMGLLARIGRCSLQGRGRRAILLCSDNDVMVTLRSAAFEELFVLTDEYPFEPSPRLAEVPLSGAAPSASELSLGRIILDAHRDLASLSAENRRAYADVITTLEADLHRKAVSH